MPQLIWLWYFYYNIWTCFYLRYVFEESEVIAWKGSVKEFSKIPQNSQGNFFAGVSFTIRLQTGGLQFHEIQNLVQVLYCKFCEIFKKIYFANVCESLLLKKKIFTGVSFHKTLGFHLKQNSFTMNELRHIFPSKFLNVKIGSFFRIYVAVASEIPEQTKTSSKSPAGKNMFKVDIRGMFQERYSGIFIISVENIFEVFGEVWFS